MMVRDISMWGYLLEHEGMPFFVPLVNTPIPVPMKSKIQIKEDLVLVIAQTDLPFYIDKNDVAHILTEESEYVPLIKRAMVYEAMRRGGRKM